MEKQSIQSQKASLTTFSKTYCNVRPVAKGGQGAVYLAFQNDESAQEVALKFILLNNTDDEAMKDHK